MLKLVREGELAGNRASFIAQPLDRWLAGVTQHLVKALLDLAPRQRARHTFPRARWTHVLQKGSRGRGDFESTNKKPVALQGWCSSAGAKGHPRHSNVAFVFCDKKHRPVWRRSIF